MKYKDFDGDIVTITTTEELRLVEAVAAHLVKQKRIGTQT